MNRTDFGEMIQDVEIMTTGEHTASNGLKVTFTEDDLATIAKNYDPAFHEAPAVIGHPIENGPAYGWIKGLQARGGKLMATMDLLPEFVETLRKGLFKKRSASLYPDLDGKGLYLRHVGFLGATPPAIKGLADIALGDGQNAVTFEFSNKEKETMSWKDKVKGLFTQAIDEIPEGTVQGDPSPVHFSEADVAKREEEAAKKAREQALLEFEETRRKLDVERRAEACKALAKQKLDDLVKVGKILPAEVAGGLLAFCEWLAVRGSEPVEFSEDRKESPFEIFLNYLEGQPTKVVLGEIAGKDKDPGTGGAAEKLARLISEKREKTPGMSYGLAFAEVQMEHPELAVEYAGSFAS